MNHNFADKVRVFIALDATDKCKSINGLSLLVEEQFELDFFTGKSSSLTEFGLKSPGRNRAMKVADAC